MTDRVLTILDTTGIQDYIFASNRLREHITASYLVEQATGAWIDEALKDIPHTKVYSGGGNAVLLFDTIDDAKKMVTAFTLRLLIDAPGLEVAVAHTPFAWATNALGGKNGIYKQTLRALSRNKVRRPNNGAMLGQSVTLACRSTGLPAVGLDPQERTRPVSAAVFAKVQDGIRKAADHHLEHLLKEHGVSLEGYDLSRDLDELGREHGEISYIAVVHADGNDMGRRVGALVEGFTEASQNAACVQQLNDFSAALKTATNNAVARTIATLLEALKRKEMRDFVYGLSRRKGKLVLPIRPLIAGGDDVTFVCDGRLGIELAALYLRYFAQECAPYPAPTDQVKDVSPVEAASTTQSGEQSADAVQKHLLFPLPDRLPGTASAGVAIVKTHYPFIRAYDLAEELCKSAKKYAEEVRQAEQKRLKKASKQEEAKDQPEEDGTATKQEEEEVYVVVSGLDWYIANTGINASLDDLRERFYAADAGSLTMRPVVMEDTPHTWRTWQNFYGIAHTFKNPAGDWFERHNKVIALREALRGEPKAVQRFRTMYTIQLLPELVKPSGKGDSYRREGWIENDAGTNDSTQPSKHTPYFDAIEALDFLAPLRLDPLLEEVQA